MDSKVDVLSFVESLFKGDIFLLSGHKHYNALILQNKSRRKNCPYLSGTMSTPLADWFAFIALHEILQSVVVR
jgi:hypothetical protein